MNTLATGPDVTLEVPCYFDSKNTVRVTFHDYKERVDGDSWAGETLLTEGAVKLPIAGTYGEGKYACAACAPLAARMVEARARNAARL